MTRDEVVALGALLTFVGTVGYIAYVIVRTWRECAEEDRKEKADREESIAKREAEIKAAEEWKAKETATGKKWAVCVTLQNRDRRISDFFEPELEAWQHIIERHTSYDVARKYAKEVAKGGHFLDAFNIRYPHHVITSVEVVQVDYQISSDFTYLETK